MKIAIGSDHAGFSYKSKLIDHITGKGHKVKDFGTFSPDSVDYPLYIKPVAAAVNNGEYERGIVLGGSGNGEAMAANRIKGIRCALCWNSESAIMARKHNDANMISLGERMISEEDAIEIVDLWLKTPFEGGRHIKRINLIDEDVTSVPCKATIQEKETEDQDDFFVLISFAYILYSEGSKKVEFELKPGLKSPTLIYIPSEENWNIKMPEWLHNRRDQIVDRLASRCKHMIYEFSLF